jgi:hypothetical protein
MEIARKPALFFFALAACMMIGASCGQRHSEASPSVRYEPETGQVVLAGDRLELLIETRAGLDPCRLRDRKSGRIYADHGYLWNGGAAPTLTARPVIVDKNGFCSVTLTGRSGALQIEQTFSASADDPGVIGETIRLTNTGALPLDIPEFSCGFAKKIHDGTNWLPDAADSRLCDVPYRRHPETGELRDFSLPELAAGKSWFSTERSPMYSRRESPIFGAEGWAWYRAGNTLLVSKYNPEAMEWSLLETVAGPGPSGSAKVLRFGGAGRWKLGDPEGAARLAPGAVFMFGETRYEALDGEWREAYASFRRVTERQGHGVPRDFDPPVHWNELYDNPLWWAEDKPGDREKYYRFKDMEAEAEKGHELGCGCLYLDPGWDTVFGSNLWAENRLGPQDKYVSWLREKYGMVLALHTPLAPWSRPEAYPLEARRMDKSGKRLDELCVASPVYIETKVARLRELCRKGAYFLMYDGSWFPGECWDPSHGHSLPITRQEHVEAILKIQQGLHEEFPDVLIEQHDPIAGPGTVRYAPTYFLHGRPGAFNEIWGFEYMIDPMDDIISRRACSLYYYNLAYGLPVYLHIDLRKDNRQAMMFWWYASTCRHLGIGGTHSDPAVREAHKAAMRTYLSLKRFYARGVFYGLDETIHVHTLPEAGSAVFDVFNLENTPAPKTIRFRPEEIGLPPGAVRIEGAPFERESGGIVVKADLAARGHLLLKVHTTKGRES